MRSYRFVFAIVLIMAAIIALPLRFADAIIGYGPPAPDNYMEVGSGPDSRNRDLQCPRMKFVGGGPSWFWTGAGSDTVMVGIRGGMHLFDSASPQTGSEHDMVVINGFRPSQVRVIREGAHLLVCGRNMPLSVTIYRQYCRGVSNDVAWNNQFEEIVFPDAGEIWLADELLDGAPSRSDIAALTRLDEFEEGKAAFKAHPKEDWRVRSFSDVLPSGWLSSLSCRHDLR